MSDIVEKLRKLKENIASTTVVSLSARQLWVSTLESVLQEIEEGEEDEDEDEDEDEEDEDEDEDDEAAPDEETVVELVRATGWPRWQVLEDFDGAVRAALRSTRRGG